MNTIVQAGRATSNYDQQQAFTARVVAMASASTSLILCMTGMYTLLAVDPKRMIFRYQLICFLLCSDFLKALILLIYPVRVLITPLTYYSVYFCQVMGFLTALSIEAADFAILAFAVHTLLIIFRPEMGVTFKSSSRTEAGLYRFRFYVYGGCILVPLIFASLAFIGGKDTYEAFTCWCYLPLRPIWLRYVLSWGPRYTILLTIIVVYVVIYVHVIRKSRRVSSVLSRMQRRSSSRDSTTSDSHNTLTEPEHTTRLVVASVSRALNSRWSSFTYKFYPRQQTSKEDTDTSLDPSEMSSNESVHTPPQYPEENSPATSPTFIAELQPKSFARQSNLEQVPGNTPTSATTATNIQIASVEVFKKREKAIRRQVTSVFLYPLAYMFIWFLPFVMSIFQTRTGQEPRGIYWLKIAMAFFQPINGFVDCLVFFYREKPWQQTIMRNFERNYSARLSNASSHIKTQNLLNLQRQLQGSGQSRPSHPMSVCSTLMGTPQYSKWRRFLSWLRFPLFRLPSDESINIIEWRVMNRDKRGKSNSDNMNPLTLSNDLQVGSEAGPGSNICAGAGVNFSKYKPGPPRAGSSSSEPFSPLTTDAPKGDPARASMPASPTNVTAGSGSQNPDSQFYSYIPKQYADIELQPPPRSKIKTQEPVPNRIVSEQYPSTSTPTSSRKLLVSMLWLPVSLTRRSLAGFKRSESNARSSANKNNSENRLSATLQMGDNSSSEEIDFVTFLRAEP